MNFSQYQKRDWSKEPVREHFRAVAEIYKSLSADRIQKIRQGYPDNCLDYSYEVEFMTSLMVCLSYSDNFACTVKAAAIASAEAVLKDPFITERRKNWSLISRDKGELYTTARVVQGHMTKAIAKFDFYGEYDRVTDIQVMSKPPITDVRGIKSVVYGSMLSSVNPPPGNSHRIVGPTQFETLELNMYPSSVVKDPIEWFGVQWHENFHGMEAIHARHKVFSDVKNDSDLDILLAKSSLCMDDDFRSLAYYVYRTSPSERLARMGQDAFIRRMVTEQLVIG